MKYCIKEYTLNHWHVVNEYEQPIYDESRNGDDKPVIFKDPDIAQQVADELNKQPLED